jgi:hypothetical protein
VCQDAIVSGVACLFYNTECLPERCLVITASNGEFRCCCAICYCLRLWVGVLPSYSIIIPLQGFQGMPGFPAWLGKYSAQNKRARLTKEIVHHTALSVGQVRRPVLLL